MWGVCYFSLMRNSTIRKLIFISLAVKFVGGFLHIDSLLLVHIMLLDSIYKETIETQYNLTLYLELLLKMPI